MPELDGDVVLVARHGTLQKTARALARRALKVSELDEGDPCVRRTDP
jgi:hypothetical protein